MRKPYSSTGQTHMVHRKEESAYMSPTMKPSSALNQEASAETSSSLPCMRTMALRIDLPDSRCCL